MGFNSKGPHRVRRLRAKNRNPRLHLHIYKSSWRVITTCYYIVLLHYCCSFENAPMLFLYIKASRIWTLRDILQPIVLHQCLTWFLALWLWLPRNPWITWTKLFQAAFSFLGKSLHCRTFICGQTKTLALTLAADSLGKKSGGVLEGC